MGEALILDTARGPFTLRPERPEDADFLYALFRSHMLASVAAMPVDDAMKESLLRMQFRSQAMTYRAQYPHARFDILERDATKFGRLIVHEDEGVATFVDFALLPENRGAGLGSAVIRRVLDWVAERCAIVRLSILWNNQASLRMTSRLGFVQVGEAPPYVQMEWRRPARHDRLVPGAGPGDTPAPPPVESTSKMPPSVRTEWDLDPDFLTVNHGSFGATPRCVTEAQRAWQERLERQPSRFMNTDYPIAIRKAADTLGSFVNANGRDIAFVENATTGCNAVLRSLSSIGPDNTVTLLSHAYGAVHNTVRFVTEKLGAKIVQAAIPYPGPTEDLLVAAVAATLTPQTRLAVIDHITSASAIVVPVQRIVALCHAAGVPVLIDGAHAPGQIDLDLTAIGADWYVGNCHKWLCAPKGCAFLHAAPAAQAGLHPGTISHGYGQGFLAEFDWTGTTDPSRFLAVKEAIAFHHRLGGSALRERNRRLAPQGGELVARRLNTSVGTSGSVAGAMATIRLPVEDPTPAHALAIRQRLMAAGTDAPVHALDGALWLRLSAFAYNEPDDYARLAEVVAKVLRG